MNIESCLQSLKGRYDILAEIGQGGMGRVYQAVDRQLGRTVAVKIPLPSDDDKDRWSTILARFRREGRTLARLSDPGVLKIYDIGEAGGLPYIISEWIDGDPLHRIEKPWTGAQITAIASTLCVALNHAHELGVTHRDIKPANIILRPDGTPVLIDFGIARVSGDTNVTQTGSVLGTLVYLAPELLLGHDLSPAVDQYSLGCVFYELAVGKTWIEASTLHEIIRALLNNKPAPILENCPDFDPKVAALIEKMISREPKGRFSSMNEACNAWIDLADPNTSVALPKAREKTGLPSPEHTSKYLDGSLPESVMAQAKTPRVSLHPTDLTNPKTLETQPLNLVAPVTPDLVEGPSTSNITLRLTRRKRIFRGIVTLFVVGFGLFLAPKLYSIFKPTTPGEHIQNAISNGLWGEVEGLAEGTLVDNSESPKETLERADRAAIDGKQELAIFLYRHTLSAQPDLRNHAPLLSNLSEWAILGRDEASALLLAYPSTALYNTLTVHSLGAGYEERRRAIDLLNNMGQQKRVDLGRVSLADLKDGPTCPIRLAAIITLNDLVDRRAIPHLQELLKAPFHERFDNACLIEQAKLTLKMLKQPTD